MSANVHRGSDFDNFLKEEGILREVTGRVLTRRTPAAKSKAYKELCASLKQGLEHAQDKTTLKTRGVAHR